MKKRTILIAVAVVIVGLIAFSTLRSKAEKPVKATVEKVKRTDLTELISASGEIKPKKNINISAQIPGRILKIGVVEGQEVKRGEFLLQLDASQYEANADRDRAFIQSTKTEEIKAEATLKRNQDAYARQKNLYDNQLISKEQLEQSKVQLEIADASFKAISFQIQQAQASLKSTLDNLSKTVFSAPIDGIITSLRVEEGEVAIIGTMNNPGTVLMTIADLSVMEVEVEVDETDVIGVKLGQTANVRVDAFPDRVFKGLVTEIGSSALQKTAATASTQESRDFKVVVTLEDPKQLKPGLSASADIIAAEKKDVLAVPISALVLREKKGADGVTIKADKKTVEEEGLFIVDAGRAKFVPVVKGITGELEIEIKSGLKEGQEIIAGPYDALRLLKDGDLIKIDEKIEAKKTK
ncbi:MAG: efflux RND transporter periplasmic adaptor subunit [Candidatus Aminicenantes bacterium]|nr:efflux RND transporter periplasmic adaptor subunit [Candidatus Aminicenantes bacterium]